MYLPPSKLKSFPTLQMQSVSPLLTNQMPMQTYVSEIAHLKATDHSLSSPITISQGAEQSQISQDQPLVSPSSSMTLSFPPSQLHPQASPRFMDFLEPIETLADSWGYRISFEKTHCSPPKIEPPATFPHPFAIWCTEAANIKGGIVLLNHMVRQPAIEFVRIALFDATGAPIIDGLKDSTKRNHTFCESHQTGDRFYSTKFGVDKTSSEIFGCTIGEFPHHHGGYFRLAVLVKFLGADLKIHFLPEFWSVSKLPQFREENPMWKEIALKNGFDPNPKISMTCVSRGYSRKTSVSTTSQSTPQPCPSSIKKRPHQEAFPNMPEADNGKEKDAISSTAQSRFTYEVDFTEYTQGRTFRLRSELLNEMPQIWHSLCVQSTIKIPPPIDYTFGPPSISVTPTAILHSHPPAVFSEILNSPKTENHADLFDARFTAFWDKIQEDSERFQPQSRSDFSAVDSKPSTAIA